MKRLKEKCRNENYFQTIRFYYHRFPESNKIPFILEVASENILLASQCLMSDKKNDEAEIIIGQIAIEDAQAFSNTAKSTAGLLALAEFGLYDKILDIFNSLSKPDRIHVLVLNQLFREADESIYLKFVETFTDYDHLPQLLTTFSSYKGAISITPETLKVLHSLITKLLKGGYSGFIRVFLTSYNLWDSTQVILGNDYDRIVQSLMLGSYQEISLAYYITTYSDHQSHFSADDFITALSQFRTKKSLSLALEIAIKSENYDNASFNESLVKVLSKKHKSNSNVNQIKGLLRSGLQRYAEYNHVVKNAWESLTRKSTATDKSRNKRNEDDWTLKPFTFDLYPNITRIFGIIENIDSFTKQYQLSDFWLVVFDYLVGSTKRIFLSDIIMECAELYKADFRMICNILRQYNHFGRIAVIKPYGYYIESASFRTERNCFLHMSLIGGNEAIDNVNLTVGEDVEFNIVGINQETKRINVYLTKAFYEFIT